MDTHLGYAKHETKAHITSNCRNGKSKKTVVSKYGEQEILVLPDRLSEFEPMGVKKHPSNVTGIEDQIVVQQLCRDLHVLQVSARNPQAHLHDE